MLLILVHLSDRWTEYNNTRRISVDAFEIQTIWKNAFAGSASQQTPRQNICINYFLLHNCPRIANVAAVEEYHDAFVYKSRIPVYTYAEKNTPDDLLVETFGTMMRFKRDAKRELLYQHPHFFFRGLNMVRADC